MKLFKILCLVFPPLINLSCAGTTPLVLRSVDFMSPHVSEKVLGGQVRVGIDYLPTQVVLFDRSMSPSPSGTVVFDHDVRYATAFFDIGVSVLPKFELYSLDKGAGVKWQFLSAIVYQVVKLARV